MSDLKFLQSTVRGILPSFANGAVGNVAESATQGKYQFKLE